MSIILAMMTHRWLSMPITKETFDLFKVCDAFITVPSGEHSEDGLGSGA